MRLSADILFVQTEHVGLIAQGTIGYGTEVQVRPSARPLGYCLPGR